MSDLDTLARSLTRGAAPYAFCGIAVWRSGRSQYFTACADGYEADEDSIFRVASISKIITGAAFERAAKLVGQESPYTLDAGPLLGLDLRHPRFPDMHVTLGMLMSHTSGLTDDGGYAFDGAFQDNWSPHARFGRHPPGTYFQYCNLGYILLAAAAEVLSGKRFDALVADVTAHDGVLCGPNWAGLTPDERDRFFPTFRRDGGAFEPMIDGERPGPFDADQAYVLGRHTARFSPQGGMRMSLRGMLDLSVERRGLSREPIWHVTDGGGEYLDGLFQDYGAGEQILPNPPFYPRPLIGHFGNAYGFRGGTWSDVEAEICFAYALNGAAMGDESDDLAPAEEAIFRAIAQAA